MKNSVAGSLLVLFLTVFLTTASGQQRSSVRQDLIQRSTANRQTGWVFLTAGGVGTVAGAIGMKNTSLFEGPSWPYFALTAGSISILLSIPFFIRSSTQSAEAARMAVVPPGLNLYDPGAVHMSLPALRMRIGR